MNIVIYNNSFLEDLKIRENTIMITGYQLSYGESDHRGKTEGLEVLYEDSSKILQILVDFKGFNLSISDESGYVDVNTNTGDTNYDRIDFFYCIYPGNTEKLAFSISTDGGSINDLCVNRNIFEIKFPPDVKATLRGINSDELKFLEGPGKQVGSNLWIDGEEPDLDSMVSRNGYYRYTRIENTKTPGSLGWSPEGSRVYSKNIIRKYKNLKINFGNFTQDPSNDIWVRDGLSTDGGIIYLHGTAEYIDYSDSQEINKGILPIESIPELEIKSVGNTDGFKYSINNFLKSISYDKTISYIPQYGIFQAYIPKLIPEQEEIYSPKFKLALKPSDIYWDYDPQTTDMEGELYVIVLEGKKNSSRDVIFKTNIPKEYLNSNTCKVTVEDASLYRLFDFILSYEDYEGDENYSSICRLTIEALDDNNETSWQPQKEGEIPYFITFDCSIGDGYSKSMYVAQYPKTPDLVVLNNSNEEVTELEIPADSSYRAVFTVGIKKAESDKFTKWNSQIIEGGNNFRITAISQTTAIYTGDVYHIPEDQTASPDITYKYQVINTDNSPITEDKVLGSIKFISNSIDSEEDEETEITWKDLVGTSFTEVTIIRKSPAAVFEWVGDPDYYIGAISYGWIKEYELPIRSNRSYKVELLEGAKSITFYNDSLEKVDSITCEPNKTPTLYNTEVKSDFWKIGETVDLTKDSEAGTLKITSLADDIDKDEKVITKTVKRISPTGEANISNFYTYSNSEGFTLKYYTEYDENYPNVSPDHSRFGVISNCFDSLDPEFLSKFYYISATNSEIKEIIPQLNGFTAGNDNTTEFFKDSYDDVNQEATVEINCDKDNIIFNNFYFPTVPIAYAEINNWRPGLSGDYNIIGIIFMKPFDNSFWYKINDDEDFRSSYSLPKDLIFPAEVNDESTSTITLVIRSRYTTDINELPKLNDGLSNEYTNIEKIDVNSEGTTITRIINIKKTIETIIPSSENNYCRFQTTYKLKATINNNQDTDPYIIFDPLTLTPTNLENKNQLSDFVDETKLNALYNLEKGHHGERLNSYLAKQLLNGFGTGGYFNLIQRGKYVGNISLTPNFETISPSGSKDNNHYLSLNADESIGTPEISSSVVNRATISEEFSSDNKLYINEIFGVIQTNPSDENYLWSDDYTSDNQGVFQYASPGNNKTVSISLTLTYFSKYDPEVQYSYNYQKTWNQPGYTNAIYFYFNNKEKFGIGIYDTNNLGESAYEIDYTIPGGGETINALTGIIGINNTGVTGNNLSSLYIDSFAEGTYNYDSTSSLTRRDTRTNLSLTFPINNTGSIKSYYLVLGKQNDSGDTIHKVLIKFNQEVYSSDIKFVNPEGTELVGESTLEILSDGTILGNSGIAGGENGYLYLKTSLNISDNNIRLDIPGSSIKEDPSGRVIEPLGNNIYKIKFKFYPNRVNSSATGNLDIYYGETKLTSSSISVTQYSFAIMLQYYKQGDSSSHSVIPTVNMINEEGICIIDESGLTISNVNKSCFKIVEIYCNDPGWKIDESNSEELKTFLRSNNTSIDHYEISNTNIFNDFYVELVINDTSSMSDATPYVWATYVSDYSPSTEIDNIDIEFWIKVYNNGDDNYLYLMEDGNNTKYQLFKFKYTCKKLIES